MRDIYVKNQKEMNIFNGEEFFETQGVVTISEQMKELDLNQDEWCINFGGVGVSDNDTKPKEKHSLHIMEGNKYNFAFHVNGEKIGTAYKGDTIEVRTDKIKGEIAPKFVIFYNKTSKEIALKETITDPENPSVKMYVYEFKMPDYDIDMLCNDTGAKPAYDISKDNESQYNFKTNPSSEASEGDMVTVTTDPIEGERPTGDEPEVTVTESKTQEKQKATFVEKHAVETGGGKDPVVSYEYVYVFLMPASDVSVTMRDSQSGKHKISKNDNSEYDFTTQPNSKAENGETVMVTTDPIEGDRQEGEEPEVKVTEKTNSGTGNEKKGTYVGKYAAPNENEGNGGGAKAGSAKAGGNGEDRWIYVYVFDMPDSDVEVEVADAVVGE